MVCSSETVKNNTALWAEHFSTEILPKDVDHEHLFASAMIFRFSDDL